MPEMNLSVVEVEDDDDEGHRSYYESLQDENPRVRKVK